MMLKTRAVKTISTFWAAGPGLVIIVLSAFALRLYKLGAQSLWYDETVSAFLAGQTFPALIAHTARDIHPPGYYILLHLWTGLVGDSEFALAYFSLIFGVLLMPLTYRLARDLIGKGSPAFGAALFVAFSPYNIWYSQEVRMYTLAASLGVIVTWMAVQAQGNPSQARRRFWLGYVIAAALGLYVLYYFAFLLITINLFFFIRAFFPIIRRRLFASLLTANFFLGVVYLPWLPIAWRQVTGPPVPPWRTPDTAGKIIIESWSALSLGQSVEPAAVWLYLLFILLLYILGLVYLNHPSFSYGSARTLCQLSTRLTAQSSNLPAIPGSNSSFPLAFFLAAYTFGPLLLIQLLSFIIPLYHVRYVFTYSPAFYIVLGAGLGWLAARLHRGVAIAGAGLIVAASLFSIYQLHFNARYWADDYRTAVNFIQDRWQPGDIILTNAGYTYTAFVYYNDLPQLERRRLVPYQPPVEQQRPRLLQAGTVDGPDRLGWGDPNSDFYPMTAAETVSALESLSNDYARLWLLRAYDTVTDPTALIRTWLAEKAIPIEDEVFSGESGIRAQGYLLNKQPQLRGEAVQFADGMVLTGWELSEQPWQPGQIIQLKLGWMVTAQPGVDYKMSLKLWTPTGDLAAQGQDTWPVGTLYRATRWPINQVVCQPAQISLPFNLPPGRYWLNVELYHPETLQPLARVDGADPVVTLGPVVIE